MQKIRWIKRADAIGFETSQYVLGCHYFYKRFCAQLNK